MSEEPTSFPCGTCGVVCPTAEALETHVLTAHPTTDLEQIRRLSKDLKAAAALLTPTEARYFVDAYYAMQGDRIRAANQVRALTQSKEPHTCLTWLAGNAGLLERNVLAALGAYANASPVGRWAQSIIGIGPVLSAGLLAHIDITKAPTAGHIWRFAGLDPTVKWTKQEECMTWIREHPVGTQVDEAFVLRAAQVWGRQPASLLRAVQTDYRTGEVRPLSAVHLAKALARRPWNTRLKTLCWKIGESFVKVSGHDDVYGKFYVERKAIEIAHNESGALAGQAAEKLAKVKIGKTTDAYKSYSAGRLPPAHIHARAKRHVVKLFLSHFQDVAYTAHYGKRPPKPYVITREAGHAHEIKVPHWPFPEIPL